MNPLHSLLTRRRALSIGGHGMLGLSLAQLLKPAALCAESTATEAPRVRAKSVIFLFQWGGPSHIDMFDMKPEATENIRGPYQPIASSAPGISVCEHLPNVAKIMDKVTLVRSVNHRMKNHNPAGYYALTGHAPPVDDIRLRDTLELFPAYGSAVARFGPGAAELPTFVALPHVMRDGELTPGQHASFLGKQHDPLLITNDPNDPNFALPELSLPAGLNPQRMASRAALQSIINSQARLAEHAAAARGLDAQVHRALEMVHSSQVRQAFDLSSEPAELRDAYGRHTYGQSMLLARRLVEAGVRFVNVYFDPSIGGQSKTAGGWDTHGFNNTRMFPIIEARHLPMTDQTLPVFLNDLDQRGLLDDTLVIWMGEFGRTPRINSAVSRDHWPQCYTVLLAGGGVKRGFVYGASDKKGASPARDPVRLDDLSATMFHLLGIDPHQEMIDPVGRPFPIADGRVIHDLMA
jgi:hypothetical protein